jgi:hypothetical protein
MMIFNTSVCTASNDVIISEMERRRLQAAVLKVSGVHSADRQQKKSW